MTINEGDLRQRGVRLTPQRRMILDAIAQQSGHISAEEIYDRIASVYPDMNRSTVYRNLERLCDLRLVAVTDLGGGRARYEALDSARHHHLICHRCGDMSDLDDQLVASLRQGIAEIHQFDAEIDHLAIWGVCSRCKDADDKNQSEEASRAHP